MAYRKTVVILVATAVLISISYPSFLYAQKSNTSGHGTSGPRPPKPPSNTGQQGPNTSQIMNGIMGAIQQSIQSGGHPDGPGYGTGHPPGHIDDWNRPDPYYYTPQYYTQPAQQTQPTVQPQPNVLPTAPADPIKEPVTLVDPIKNSVLKANSLSAGEIQTLNEQIDQQNEKILEQLGDLLPDQPAIIDEIQKLPTGVSPDKQKAILAMVQRGDVGELLISLNTDKKSPAGIKLVQQATAYAKLNALKTKVANGTLTPNDLANMRKALMPFLPNPSAVSQTEKSLFDLAVNAKLKNLLSTAVPGNGTIPFGNNVTLVWISSLPQGTLITLGNGTVLVGTGSNAFGITIGTGSVAQAIGMQIAAGEPVPESQSDLVTSGTVLKNAGESDVHYILNETQNFTMKPKFSQALPKGVTWVATFDRGGDYGQARYQLEEGTYKFTPTKIGWELYLMAEFNATIDNTRNATDFNYVLNNTAYTVAAHEKREHSEKYLPIIRFDNGSGKVRQKNLSSGVFSISMTADNTLDLFTAESLAAAPSAPNDSSTSTPKVSNAADKTPINLFGRAAAPTAKSGSFGNMTSAEAFFAQPGLRESLESNEAIPTSSGKD
jgi:hypothetical protein